MLKKSITIFTVVIRWLEQVRNLILAKADPTGNGGRKKMGHGRSDERSWKAQYSSRDGDNACRFDGCTRGLSANQGGDPRLIW